jgi:hypothetical protein
MFLAVAQNDVESSKIAFVSSASAIEKWTSLTGLVGKLKGIWTEWKSYKKFYFILDIQNSINFLFWLTKFWCHGAVPAELYLGKTNKLIFHGSWSLSLDVNCNFNCNAIENLTTCNIVVHSSYWRIINCNHVTTQTLAIKKCNRQRP